MQTIGRRAPSPTERFPRLHFSNVCNRQPAHRPGSVSRRCAFASLIRACTRCLERCAASTICPMASATVTYVRWWLPSLVASRPATPPVRGSTISADCRHTASSSHARTDAALHPHGERHARGAPVQHALLPPAATTRIRSPSSSIFGPSRRRAQPTRPCSPEARNRSLSERTCTARARADGALIRRIGAVMKKSLNSHPALWPPPPGTTVVQLTRGT